MTDLSITAASVISAPGSTIERGLAGATITAGQTVYKSSSTEKYLLADDNSATAEVRVPVGIALNSASSGQPLAVHKAGDITIGAALTPGVAYYQSDTPGGICVVGDLAAGEYPCAIGMATSATVLHVDINSSGVAL